MDLRLIERVVEAVLYEGYILYPYRSSAVKNRQRWNFGVLYPEAYSEAQSGTDACSMQTECLALADGQALLDVRVRFLHLLAREACKLEVPVSEMPDGGEPDFQVVPSLEVGGKLFQTWQEAIEREASVEKLKLSDLVTGPKRVNFSFPSMRELEPLRDPNGRIVGLVVRKQERVEGAIEIAAERAEESLFKISVRILNRTSFEMSQSKDRDRALMRSLVSAHTILGIRDGEFVSLLDPPGEFREYAAGCRNTGAWPVLVGREGERDAMLSSPIILYDYPQVAPESAGALFDSTEIDEILTLRIMTLTEEEKREMRQTDERAREILERTETLPLEQLMKMHGAVRSLRPVKEDE